MTGTPPHQSAPWLLGAGAVLTLVGGLLAEISSLLLFMGTPATVLVWTIGAGIGSVAVGVALLVVGKRTR